MIGDAEVTLLRESDSPVRLQKVLIRCSDSFTIQGLVLMVSDYGIKEGF